MKKHLFLLGLLLPVVGMLFMSLSVQAQETGDFTVPLSDPGKRAKLKTHLNSGSITIKGTARQDVLIKYSTNEDEDKEDEKTEKEKNGLKRISSGTIDLEVSENNNFVKVESSSWNQQLDLEIEVPSGIDLQVHTYNNGDLHINNIQGELELTNFNGEITAGNVSGSVIATTYNGEIKISFDKVTEGTPMSFSTFNGDVDLTFPEACKASFKMKTERGEVYSAFDISLVKSEPVQKKEVKAGTYKVVIDDWVRGDINGGGAEISVKNYNGDIYIRKKQANH